MWLRCGTPDCSCQGAHELPPLCSIDLIAHIPSLGETRQINEEGTELDVIFDIFSGTMVLRQHVRKPQVWHESQRVTSVYFTQSNSTFINLEGLADNSILLTFQYCPSPNTKTTTIKTKIRRRAHGFLPSPLNEGRLVEGIENGTADDMDMQVRIPSDRTMGWKTIALALLTYREIDRETWHRLVSAKLPMGVAGFDWIRLQLKDGNEMAVVPYVSTASVGDMEQPSSFEPENKLDGSCVFTRPAATSVPAGCSDYLHAGDLDFNSA